MKQYDVLIIGAGQAGVPLANKLAQQGKKIALIEKRFVGGTCVNDGCTPTKTMIASARMVHQAKKATDSGILIGDLLVDFKKIKRRKDELVESSRTSAQKKLESTEGVELIFGEAAFSGEKELTIITSQGKKEIVSADWIFINTGAKATLPELKGLDTVDYLTSSTLLDVEQIPDHLVIIGGSYLSLEFGQMFHRFGSKVTILEKSSRILKKEDEDVSLELTKILREEGLKILCDVSVDEIEQHKDHINLRLRSKTGTKNIHASHLLIATGRSPQTESLRLDIPGIQTDTKGHILVNEKLETNVKGIYALGDVNGGPAFTHIAYNDFTIVYRNLIENEANTTSGRPLPYCLFTDPQLGRIGLTEAQAKEKGIDFLVAKIPMSKVARGTETGETSGFMKALIDPKKRTILGASILSAEGGEIMAILQIAMEGGITYDRLQHGIFAHPTYAEALNVLFSEVGPQSGEQ